MNVEELDGFFAALIAGPEVVLPSEYLPGVFGGELEEACEFESLQEAKQIFDLLMRQWNTIARTLNQGEGLPTSLVGRSGRDLPRQRLGARFSTGRRYASRGMVCIDQR